MAWQGLFRSDPRDREIRRLALPAFGALIAEPLYVLSDTAIVGHINTTALGGLAAAGIVLSVAYGICNLAYPTTAAVARRFGSGDVSGATRQGIDALWLAVLLGVVLVAVLELLATPIMDVIGSSDAVAQAATTYLRISALGAPAYIVASAAAGVRYGMQDTRLPLLVGIGANTLNIALEIILVHGFDQGLAGSAWGTVVAQWCAAIAYLVVMRSNAHALGCVLAPSLRIMRQLAVQGSQIGLRTASLLLAFLAATAVAARIGDHTLAAHQIVFQVFVFLAFACDAVAIAGQAMVGRLLGAGEPDEARATATRLLQYGARFGIAAGILLAILAGPLAYAFSNDVAVRDLARQGMWFVAVLQPLCAVPFVLDGVLIGAGDSRFLATAMVGVTLMVFAPALTLVVVLGGGFLALWFALGAFLVARLATNVLRFRTTGWQVLGATAQ